MARFAIFDTNLDDRWRPHAACAHLGPTGFDSPALKALCGDCPAAEPCLWAALALEAVSGYRYGIWGGTGPARRARIAEGLGPVDVHAWYRGVVEGWAPPRRRQAPRVAA